MRTGGRWLEPKRNPKGQGEQEELNPRGWGKGCMCREAPNVKPCRQGHRLAEIQEQPALAEERQVHAKP